MECPRSAARAAWGLSAFKDHCSFFPMSASLLDDFADDVKGYRT